MTSPTDEKTPYSLYYAKVMGLSGYNALGIKNVEHAIRI